MFKKANVIAFVTRKYRLMDWESEENISDDNADSND